VEESGRGGQKVPLTGLLAPEEGKTYSPRSVEPTDERPRLALRRNGVGNFLNVVRKGEESRLEGALFRLEVENKKIETKGKTIHDWDRGVWP